jgi:hypothetical protein
VADADRSSAANRAAVRAADLDTGRLRVSSNVTDGGEGVAVHVDYRSATDVPLVGLLLPDVELRGDAVMRVEAIDR